MAALVAARFNPGQKCFYQRLVNAGKSPKLALTAVMHKLIILASTLLKQNRKIELMRWMPPTGRDLLCHDGSG
jgi:transposase